ncbi:hypothetical protein EWM64_g2723 [Hericium alpestre]|uniref:threonine synthase n=1 Tax=Hericium alpestre TaxID=135208 RepID=A0A4Z0A5U2_9AGAM|nr:hypothetical protein EWM64_g2723 [Hericium alpestre]
MKYLSTRGGDEKLTFEEAVLTGLAPNGGLYIPDHIPTLPPNWQEEWKSYSFVDLSLAVLSLYISPEELSREELRTLVEKSYSTFRHPDVTPVKKFDGKRFILELFHGPTFAFKDVALQLLGNLFEFFLLRRNAGKAPGEKPEKLTVVGATSGDTGSAAIYGLRNKANISIFILHPKGRVSPIQEAQMTTVTDPNVHNIAVKGTFDDCQDIVKALFADREFNAKHRLGAVNSINWARILAQTVYYFFAYFHVRAQLPPGDAELQFVVPTGNFGDILAGYYAKRMGLPMGKLVVATSVSRPRETGEKGVKGSCGEVRRTRLSNGMPYHVSLPSCGSRLWSDRSAAVNVALMEMACRGRYEGGVDSVGVLSIVTDRGRERNVSML